MPEPMPAARRVAYALGNAGFNLADRLVVSVAVYFYLPPPGRGLVAQIPESPFLGALTVFGAAMLVGRLFDMAADPVVGHASDRSRSRLGRRRSFLAWGVLPMVVLPALLFFPPGAPGSALNVGWLFGLLALYFVVFTVYVAPYLALIPEIAWTQGERVDLGRMMALLTFPALAFGVVWPAGIDLGRAAGLDTADALRWLVVIAALVSLLLCLGPIVAVDERRYARTRPANLRFGAAVRETLRNRAFLVYLGAQLSFLFAVNLIQPATPYYATVVLGRSEGFAAVIGGGSLVGALVGFAAMSPLVRRFGPKRTLMGCIAVLGLAMASLGLLEADAPGGPRDRLNLIIGVPAIGALGLSVAGLLVLPNVLISQLVDADERRTGANRAAMYFGIQGLFTKWVYGAGLWVFTFLLARFGNSPEQPHGVLLIGPVAAVACLLALFLFARYPERELLAETQEEVR